MENEEICLEVCGSCTQEQIWQDQDCKVCHRNMLEALNILRRFTWCAYCGKEFPLDTVTADQVGEHIATCEKHPLFLANKRIKELEKALDQVGSKLDEQVVYYGDVITAKNDRIKELAEDIFHELDELCIHNWMAVVSGGSHYVSVAEIQKIKSKYVK